MDKQARAGRASAGDERIRRTSLTKQLGYDGVLRHQLRFAEVLQIGFLTLLLLSLGNAALRLVGGDVGSAGASAVFGVFFMLLFGWWAIAIVYGIALLITLLLRLTGRLSLHLLAASALLGAPATLIILGGAPLRPDGVATIALSWGAPLLARLIFVPWTAGPRPEYFEEVGGVARGVPQVAMMGAGAVEDAAAEDAVIDAAATAEENR